MFCRWVETDWLPSKCRAVAPGTDAASDACDENSSQQVLFCFYGWILSSGVLALQEPSISSYAMIWLSRWTCHAFSAHKHTQVWMCTQTQTGTQTVKKKAQNYKQGHCICQSFALCHTEKCMLAAWNCFTPVRVQHKPGCAWLYTHYTCTIRRLLAVFFFWCWWKPCCPPGQQGKTFGSDAKCCYLSDSIEHVFSITWQLPVSTHNDSAIESFSLSQSIRHSLDCRLLWQTSWEAD